MIRSIYQSDFYQDFLDAFWKYMVEACVFTTLCIALFFCTVIGVMSRMEAIEVVHASVWARILYPMWKRSFKEWLTAR